MDYRRLNKKTIPDSQPLPRIQDILDNLNSQEWFSTLDMSKAYHQGYIAEECRHRLPFLRHGHCTNGLEYHLVFEMLPRISTIY